VANRLVTEQPAVVVVQRDVGRTFKPDSIWVTLFLFEPSTWVGQMKTLSVFSYENIVPTPIESLKCEHFGGYGALERFADRF
jgi:hypothetical protein